MVSEQNGRHVFTGTTSNEELARRLENYVLADEDRRETDVVREAVDEFLPEDV
jgi:hypothetical protein